METTMETKKLRKTEMKLKQKKYSENESEKYFST